ncbi:RNA polymerase sigma factor [Granulicella aggregans]|nr:sigma-70 family RNA polymerase sigma factor [Granulicella aggregans]
MIPYKEMKTTELIKACAESDHAMPWQALVLQFQRPISLSVLRTLRRWGISAPDIVEDLVQETYLKLCHDRCRKLLRFAIDHPDAVNGYVKTVATNVTHDYIKSQRTQKRGNGEVGQFSDHVEPEARSESSGGTESIRAAVLMREIDDCLAECTEGTAQARDRLIFWLHYQQGMTATAIAALPVVGLTTKGVESAIFRLTREVRVRMTARKGQPGSPSGSTAKGFGRAESY